MLHSSSNKVRVNRLLIVDDDEDFRQSLRVILEEQGFCCNEAKDGIEALQLLIHQPVDIVLTDYRMPRLNGLRLKDVLSKYPLFRSLPVILLTAELNEALHLRAQELDFAAVFVKPFDMGLLLASLHQILSGEPRVDQT